MLVGHFACTLCSYPSPPPLQATQELRESLDVNDVSDGSPFPDAVAPGLRPMFRGLRAALVPLALRVLRSLALSLGLDRDFFALRHRRVIDRGNCSKMRSLYYPPITGE